MNHMNVKRTIFAPMPEELVRVTQELCRYPASLRLAEQFYSVGMPIIKQSGVYIPFASNETKITYGTQMGRCFGKLILDRSKQNDTDSLECYLAGSALGMKPEPDTVDVTVYRSARASKLSRFSNQKDIGFKECLKEHLGLRKLPFLTAIAVERDGKAMVTTYDLICGRPPQTEEVNAN